MDNDMWLHMLGLVHSLLLSLERPLPSFFSLFPFEEGNEQRTENKRMCVYKRERVS